jgi:hypothetical protein
MSACVTAFAGIHPPGTCVSFSLRDHQESCGKPRPDAVHVPPERRYLTKRSCTTLRSCQRPNANATGNRHLNHLLREPGSTIFAEGQCATFYADTMGRPSLPPGIYFRLLLIRSRCGGPHLRQPSGGFDLSKCYFPLRPLGNLR